MSGNPLNIHDIISSDINRVRLIERSGNPLVVKNSTYSEFENYYTAKKKLSNLTESISVNGIAFHVGIPESIEWDPDNMCIVLNYIEGTNLEALLKSQTTYTCAKSFLQALLSFFIKIGFHWLDFSPRNIIISFEQKSIVLVDFEKGFVDVNSYEYISLIIEEYGAFLLPEDNKYYDKILTLLQENSKLVENMILSKSKRLMVLSQLLNSNNYIELYASLIIAEIPYKSDTNTMVFPIVNYEKILSEFGYDAWGKAVARIVEYNMEVFRHNLVEYRPFPGVNDFSLSDDKKILFYNKKGYEYIINLQNSTFIPKSGLLMCSDIFDLFNTQQIESCLDIGTGSSMFLARHANAIGCTYIDAVDLDQEVIHSAKMSCKAYECNVNVFSSDVFSAVDNKKYDLILSNPPQMPYKDGLHPLHDSAECNGRKVFEDIIMNSAEHLTNHGRLLLLVFGFHGIDKSNNNIYPDLISYAERFNLEFIKSTKHTVPIRPDGALHSSVELIRKIYPDYEFLDNSNEIYILQFRKKEIDIGIDECINSSLLYRGYIKYVGVGKDGFYFREELSDGTSWRIVIKDKTCQHFPLNELNIVDELMSQFDKTHYYLCHNPARLIISASYSRKCIPLEGYPGKPIHVCESEKYVYISFINGGMLRIPKATLIIDKFYDLASYGFIEPYYIEVLENETFLITDSSVNVVKLIDDDCTVLWEYGTPGCPGCGDNELSVPVNAFFYNNNIMISEQRSHRVIEVSYEFHNIVRQFGITNEVGSQGGRLWAPQAVEYNGVLYFIMCKASNIYISYLDNCGKIAPYYGESLFAYSLFNFPRACAYSKEYNELAVCDTYHNRICIFDNSYRLIRMVEYVNDYPLRWPRCIEWENDILIIANSMANAIHAINRENKCVWSIDMSQISATNEWIQSLNKVDDCMLVAYETFVLLMDTRTFTVTFDSRDILLCRDIHQAQLLADGRILIADTGNNRVIIYDEGCSSIVDSIIYKDTILKLKKPRMVILYGDKTYIVNSGTSQIYICKRDMSEILEIYGGERGFAHNRLSIPRWITNLSENMFFISDTDNHRIVLRKLGK